MFGADNSAGGILTVSAHGVGVKARISILEFGVLVYAALLGAFVPAGDFLADQRCDIFTIVLGYFFQFADKGALAVLLNHADQNGGVAFCTGSIKIIHSHEHA